MLIVPDVQDVYTPLETDVIVQLSEVSSWLLASFYTDIGYPYFFLISVCYFILLEFSVVNT